jgi:DNA-binding transcriptional MocR family regulator
MDSATRQRVADIAAQTRTTLVVDETMVDLWYDAPPPPLAAFNPDAVITIGSAGKSFWGGLRIGWIRASSRTIASLVQARDSLDLGSPLLEQLACCWLLENENRLLPSRRAMLATRRDMCGALMAEYFPHWRFTRRKEDSLFGWNYRECWRRSFPFALKAEFTSGRELALAWPARLIAICVCPLPFRMTNCAARLRHCSRCGIV